MSAFKKLSLLLACLAASYTADALECDKGYQLLWPLRLNGNQAVELEGVANSGSRIFESAGDEDLVVPLCAKVEEKSRSFTYRHYSGNRLQQGSFADVTLQCVAGLGRPSEPKGKEYPPYIGYERDDRYILCDKLNRAAFLKLDEHYVLEQNNGGKTTLPRVGPFGLDTAAEPDPNGYIWPANITADNYFTVYEYPKGEGWADLYPISKRLCQIDKAGDISLTDIPTITISKDDVKLTAGDNLPEGTKSRCADKADLGPAICPPGTDTTISLTVAGNGRVRDAQIKPADTWGKDLTVALKAPCGKPLEILIDMIDKNAKMPGLGVNDKWDESIKVARRVKCTYTGFNPLKNGNVHFGKGSAELNHNLGKAEWWTCDEPMSLDDANSSSS